MKFGHHLKASITPAWRFHFIDYDSLKTFLKANRPPNWSTNHEECFINMLGEELKKVSAFEALKYKELERHIASVEKELLLNSLEERSLEVEDSERKSSILAELDLIAQEISHLYSFNSLNYTGFLKILKKHDKTTGMTLKPAFMVHLATQPFYKETFDVVIVKLSELYDCLKPQGPAAKPSSGTVFVRKTTKYWVHEDNVMEVKCRVIKNLPILVFGRSEGSDASPYISSVYFDNSNLDLYHERIEKVEQALAIRFRWYGKSSNEVFIERKIHHEDWTGDFSVKERFSLKEKHVNEFCRGTYTLDKKVEKWKEVKPLDECEATLRLSTEIQHQILSRGLEPVLRTFYNRTAFQHPNTAEVRISLDVQLAMIREADRCGGNWRRKEVGVNWPFPQLDEADIHRFPYAILEVKLQTAAGATPPAWITDLVNSHLVEPVPKFSKFIHGCATLLESRVRLLPFWLPQMERDIRKSPPHKQSAQSAERLYWFTGCSREEYTPWGSTCSSGGNDAVVRIGTLKGEVLDLEDQSLNHEDSSEDEATALLRKRRRKNLNFLRCLTKGGAFVRNKLRLNEPVVLDSAVASSSRQPKPIALPVRVEPKVFFANERTFLNWLHTSVLMSTIGLALLNLGPRGVSTHDGASIKNRSSIVAGLTIIPVSLLFLIYALYTYFWRDQLIRRRSPGPYNTVGGPIIITGIFIAALSINLVIWFLDHGTDPATW